MNLLPPKAAMERAFLAGDAGFDGLFVAAVRSTGIFCRPSCPARKAKPENLEYYGSPAEAQTAGYRACLRCHPESANGLPPHWLRPLFSHLEQAPDQAVSGTDLVAMGLEPARVRRWFQQNQGMSFAQYCRRRRLGRALDTLEQGGSIDDAALSHGFESHSGFREAFARHFQHTPGAAAGTRCLRAEVIPSPVGPLLIAASDEGICLLEFSDPARVNVTLERLTRHLDRPLVPGSHPLLERLKGELAEYFSGQRREFTLPLHAPGSPFQEKVWAGLQEIPYGVTWSYGQLARHLGKPDAQRAVGLANGCNRIAILIPCHRVVNTGGALGGYGGGLWRKRLLLGLEQTGQPLAGS